tara:strand:- start:1012 stop:2784 length:1773 start_codon:yes stop_codon:yes gene_type:complete
MATENKNVLGREGTEAQLRTRLSAGQMGKATDNNKLVHKSRVLDTGVNIVTTFLSEAETLSLINSAGNGSIYWGDPVENFVDLPGGDPFGTVRLVTSERVLYTINVFNNWQPSGVVDLQIAYNNSVSPEIVTDATRGALTLKNGQALDTEKVLEVANIAGTVTASVDGNGEATLNALETIGGGTFGGIIKPTKRVQLYKESDSTKRVTLKYDSADTLGSLYVWDETLAAIIGLYLGGFNDTTYNMKLDDSRNVEFGGQILQGNVSPSTEGIICESLKVEGAGTFGGQILQGTVTDTGEGIIGERIMAESGYNTPNLTNGFSNVFNCDSDANAAVLSIQRGTANIHEFRQRSTDIGVSDLKAHIANDGSFNTLGDIVALGDLEVAQNIGTTDQNSNPLVLQADGPAPVHIGQSGGANDTDLEVYGQITSENGLFTDGPTKFGSYTTTEKNALSVSAGSQIFDTTLAKMCSYNGTAWETTNPTNSRTLTLQEPTTSDNITIFRTDADITVQGVISISTGTSPSTTYVLKHSTDRSATGNLLTTTDTTTSTTTGDIAPLSDSTIPADSWVWLETSAASGSNVYLSIDIKYTED